MDLTDELARLQHRMEELQAETDRLTAELDRLGKKIEPHAADNSSLQDGSSPRED